MGHGAPIPLDFTSPLETHLNMDTVERWRASWPDYPDREIFSHLLLGVRFKADVAFQLVLQPNLSSLHLGFVTFIASLFALFIKDVSPARLRSMECSAKGRGFSKTRT